MIKTEIAYAVSACCLMGGMIISGIIYSDRIDAANSGIALIQDCEANLPRNVKCILVAKPE